MLNKLIRYSFSPREASDFLRDLEVLEFDPARERFARAFEVNCTVKNTFRTPHQHLFDAVELFSLDISLLER